MTVLGNNIDEIAKLNSPTSEFNMKNLGGLKYFLVIKVIKYKKRVYILITTKKYIGLNKTKRYASMLTY